jgi:hypothetical protein
MNEMAAAAALAILQMSAIAFFGGGIVGLFSAVVFATLQYKVKSVLLCRRGGRPLGNVGCTNPCPRFYLLDSEPISRSLLINRRGGMGDENKVTSGMRIRGFR